MIGPDPARAPNPRPKEQKFFCFFFSKKEALSYAK
jgi:hypothetical protein